MCHFVRQFLQCGHVGSPPLDDVLAAVGRVLATGRVVAVGLAATWHPGRSAAAHERVIAAVRALVDR